MVNIHLDLNSGAGQTGTTNNFIDITSIFDKKGFTPLHFACFSNSMKCAQILCDHVLVYGSGTYGQD